jgi:hypothetical protein
MRCELLGNLRQLPMLVGQTISEINKTIKSVAEKISKSK